MLSKKLTAFQEKKKALKRQHSKNRCLEMFPLFCHLVAKNNVNCVTYKNCYISILKNLEIEYSSLLKILPEEF